ncbi:hypothetical protein J4573_27090 [Actinomadura barringtoniae]|uniref:Lipoprotein n=1 Tax=Actinomadura barringtoniae TaxID=1427535 RepID=A0A939PEE9_9ACTN|nr:hypothetical protein [Actinomadura barringtoniae]MBO2450793.1 hypothetical protein [Actinomadura barringtoniae]
MSRSTGRTWKVAAATLVPLTFVLTACGDSNRPQVCDDFDSLHKSVADLRSTSLNSDGVNALQTNVSKVKSDLQTFAQSAKGQFSTQLNALNLAISQATTAISGAVGKTSPQSLAAAGSALRGAGTAFQSLEDAVNDTC